MSIRNCFDQRSRAHRPVGIRDPPNFQYFKWWCLHEFQASNHKYNIGEYLKVYRSLLKLALVGPWSLFLLLFVLSNGCGWESPWHICSSSRDDLRCCWVVVSWRPWPRRRPHKQYIKFQPRGRFERDRNFGVLPELPSFFLVVAFFLAILLDLSSSSWPVANKGLGWDSCT